MGNSKKVSEPQMGECDIPPELKLYDKPLGLEIHNFYRLVLGISHTLTVYFLLTVAWSFPVGAYILLGIYAYMYALGLTVGSHRYWTHRTFKANKALQILLMILHTAAAQGPLYYWCRIHRTHHKYTDTTADPHNSTRGFWFSHIGWLVQPKHPDVEKAFKIIYLSDLARDPIVRFQAKYYSYLSLAFSMLFPVVMIKAVYPQLPLTTAIAANMARFVFSLHASFLINSVAHMWGDKPYDKYVGSVDCNQLVALVGVGENYHNYHHTFPWDYRAREFGTTFNISTAAINFFAWVGWAYDLKTVSHKMLIDRINRTGDGSHPLHDKSKELKKVGKTEDDVAKSTSWGWGDEGISKEDLDVTQTLFTKSRHL